MLIGRGRARWGLGAVCGLLFAAGLVMSLFQPTRFVSGYFVFAALVLLELAALFVITIKSTGTPPAALVVVVLAYSALLVLPVVLVSLATGGSTSGFADLWRPLPRHMGYLGNLGTEWGFLAQGAPVFLVPVLLIALPEVLRRQVECGPAPVARAMDGQADGAARIKRLLPSWLAAAAALSTGLYAFTLHFLGGPLAKLSLLQLVVAIAFAVALLVPPYRCVARACWERGIAEVFDPAHWRKAWLKMKDDLDDAFPSLVIDREDRRAMSLYIQSGRLADLGRREEALAAIEEAVTIRRQLAEARPDAFLPDLAMSLNNQSSRLAEPGAAGGGAGRDRGSRHHPPPARRGPPRRVPARPRHVAEQPVRSGWPSLGRREEALAAIEEAVSHLPPARRGPPRRVPARPRHVAEQPVQPPGGPGAAGGGAGRDRGSRHHLPPARRGPPRRVPARPRHVAEQPVQPPGRAWGGGRRRWPRSRKPSRICRQLAEARPDAFLPDLARSLNNQSSLPGGPGAAGGGAGRDRGSRQPSTASSPRPAPTRSCPTSPRR